MKLEEKLIAWSDGKKNIKFIPQGGEILKYIGSELLKVRFEKNSSGEWTTETPEPVFVTFIGDFEPLTGTYKIVYRGKDKEGDEELRITPEGFSWNVPEEDGWMIRFVSYSSHFRMMEEELFYRNLKNLYLSGRGVLGPQEISQFSTGKERKKRLGSLNYIAAVIDTDIPGGIGEGILSFRISEISRIEKRGKKWEIGLRDQDGDYVSVQKFIEDPETHQWISPSFSIDGKVIGDLKILDIESM